MQLESENERINYRRAEREWSRTSKRERARRRPRQDDGEQNQVPGKRSGAVIIPLKNSFAINFNLLAHLIGCSANALRSERARPSLGDALGAD